MQCERQALDGVLAASDTNRARLALEVVVVPARFHLTGADASVLRSAAVLLRLEECGAAGVDTVTDTWSLDASRALTSERASSAPRFFGRLSLRLRPTAPLFRAPDTHHGNHSRCDHHAR